MNLHPPDTSFIPLGVIVGATEIHGFRNNTVNFSERADGLAFLHRQRPACGCHLLSCLEKPFTVLLHLHRHAVDSPRAVAIKSEKSWEPCNSFHIPLGEFYFLAPALRFIPPGMPGITIVGHERENTVRRYLIGGC